MASANQTLLVVDPEQDFLDWAVRHLAADDIEIVTFTDSDQALQFALQENPDLTLAEMHLQPHTGVELLRRIRQEDANAMVVLTTGFPSTSAVIEAMKLGAYDFLHKESLAYDLRPVVEGALQALEQIRQTHASEPKEDSGMEGIEENIIGRSPAMQDVFKMIGRVSRSDVPVMITGESGCGKEIVAKAIHKFSPRAAREFVAINCAAIPGNLLESELFGHEKGAFTGASSQRIGRFEQCDGGTLFLDEIGDMPIAVQSKILRVLQEGEFSRVGGNDTFRTDVRILAATNKDLEAEVEGGDFREDLFYRLNVFRIHIPPLRQRREDILPLSEFFLQRISAQKGVARVRLSDEANSVLENYEWPGNVRELENTILRACVLATGNVLLSRDIPLGRVPRDANLAYRPGATPEPLPSRDSATPAAKAPTPESPGLDALEEAVTILFDAARRNPELQLLPWLEKEMARRAFEETAGNQVQAAQLLGITRGTLRKRLERYGLTGATADNSG